MTWIKGVINPWVEDKKDQIICYLPIPELYLIYEDGMDIRMENNRIYIKDKDKSMYSLIMVIENNVIRFGKLLEAMGLE